MTTLFPGVPMHLWQKMICRLLRRRLPSAVTVIWTAFEASLIRTGAGTIRKAVGP